jgi:tight adherence protein C
VTAVALLVLALLLIGPRVAAAARDRIEGRSRRPGDGGSSDEVLLAELTALGLSAGLSFSAALDAAAQHLSSDGAGEVRRALRSPDRIAGANVANGLVAIADRALVTGAPLLASIEGYATSLRRKERAEAVERARRLPIKLLFPLALLILPGFLILTVGPALIAAADRLGL